MSNPVSRLLRNKRFWEVLGIINFFTIFMYAQPMLLGITIVFVFGLWLLSCTWWSIQRIIYSRYGDAFLKGIGIVILWLMIAGIIGFFAEEREWFKLRDHITSMLVCSGLLLIIPYLIIRSRKRHQQQKRIQHFSIVAEREHGQRASAQKRRDDARTKCELYYRRHTPEIASRFSETHFADYMHRHMHDRLTPDYVEERSVQLMTLLENHRQQIQPPTISLGQLAEWYVAQKSELQNSPLDEEEKVIAVAQLEERFMRMQDRAIRQMRPV